MGSDEEKAECLLATRHVVGRTVLFGIIWCVIDAPVGWLLFWASGKCSGSLAFVLKVLGYACFVLALYSLIYGFKKAFKVARMANWAIQNPDQFEEIKNLLDNAQKRDPSGDGNKSVRAHRSVNQPDTAALAYEACYHIIPPALSGTAIEFIVDLEKEGLLCLRQLVLRHLGLPGTSLESEALQEFDLAVVDLNAEKRCILISYPLPPKEPARLPNGMIIPAPHFSAIVYSKNRLTEASYYVLGQRVDGIGTTFREVTKDANMNLGEGCAPSREAFIALLNEN